MNMKSGSIGLTEAFRRTGRYQSLWGSFDASDPAAARRSGVTRYHLEILPPGTDALERRQLRRFRQWRLWGALAALIGSMMIASAWPGWQAPLYLACTYIAGLLIGLHLTKRVRNAAHRLNVATVKIGGSTYVEGDMKLLESCVADLDALDHERDESSIAPVQYESEWARVYARLVYPEA
jgi:hypothetical protein